VIKYVPNDKADEAIAIYKNCSRKADTAEGFADFLLLQNDKHKEVLPSAEIEDKETV
jgi:hypothetical protein